MMPLTEAQRAALLERAVEAVQHLRALAPEDGIAERRRRLEVASLAVTDAVTRGQHLHTLIANRAGCPGLVVAELITDWSAAGQALRVERHAARRYQEQVRDAAATYARRRVGAQGYGARAAVARDVGVTPLTVDAWVNQQQAT